MMDDKETVGDSIQSTSQQDFYRNYYQEGLLDDVLPFWMTRGVNMNMEVCSRVWIKRAK
ncbi:MAG: hypothetical protein VX694_00750 [Planctomycetota bacterium]|nr:hypothetical protein [Planctomycetota bacterium]